MKDLIVLCYQIRVLDEKRPIRKISTIDDEGIQKEIKEALSFQLGI